MTKYEIHPLADYFGFPMLEGKEREEFLGDIKKRGQLDPITLFEGKIIEGRNRYSVCVELKLEARTELYDGKPEEVLDFIWSKNFHRRHLTQSQKAAAAMLRANAPSGFRTDLEPTIATRVGPKVITTEQAAKEAGVGKSSVERCRRVFKGNKEVFKAIQQGKIAADTGEEIVKLPKEEQPAALKKAIAKGFNKTQAANRNGSSSKASSESKPTTRTDWTEAEVAKDTECLAFILKPSIYPQDAQLPKNDHHNAQGLRERIAWLREEESKIADYKNKDIDQMQLATNYIQAYRTNWFKWPRPEGELDERIYDWAGDLWRKQHRQRERLDIRADVRARRKQNTELPLTKPKSSFEERFAKLVLTMEDQLGNLFKPEETRKLKIAFNKFITEFWPDSSTGQVGTAEVAATQDVTPDA